jgi:DNA processing protein
MDYSVIFPTDRGYPERLRAVAGSAPLYAIGNTALLERPAIGICGSRNASDNALATAHLVGLEAAKRGLVTVSGYARGVDRLAHKGALEGGGATIAVLPQGIDSFRIVKELEPLIDPSDNFLAVSMFEPDSVWTSWRAMTRNKVIVGLSLGLLVIEARERGGTIHAAFECVRQGKPLWAVAYSSQTAGREGNRKLLSAAAIPIRHRADLSAALEAALSHPPEEVRQLALNLL